MIDLESDDESAPRRKPQQKLSDADRAKILETLKKPEIAGNIQLTATMLGLSYGQVYGVVQRDGYLKSLVPEANPSKMVPNEADMIDGDTPPPLTRADMEQHSALLRQNKLISSKDWESLGLTPAEAKEMIEFERFAQLPMIHVIRATQGQMMKNLARLQQMLNKVGSRLIEGEKSPFGPFPLEYDKDGVEKATEREWHQVYYQGLDRVLAVHNAVNKSQLSMIQAMKLAKDLGDQKEKGKKGKFGAKPLNVTPPPDATN